MRLYFHHYHYARVVHTNNSTRFICSALTLPRGNVHSFLLSDVLLGKFVCTLLLHNAKQYYIFLRNCCSLYLHVICCYCNCQHTYIHLHTLSHHQRELCRQAMISYHNRQLNATTARLTTLMYGRRLIALHISFS